MPRASTKSSYPTSLVLYAQDKYKILLSHLLGPACPGQEQNPFSLPLRSLSLLGTCMPRATKNLVFSKAKGTTFEPFQGEYQRHDSGAQWK